MPYTYLLDTNIISDLVRHPTGQIFQRLSSIGEASVCTSIVVACELRFGAAKSRSARLQQKLEQILETMPVLPLESPIEIHYAEIRTHLEREGTSIGPNDLLIAAHALALNLTVVTANVREFSRVPKLLVENWL
ncbi:MAG: type II toxin-antitoxin system VapC family toxin [Stenomitos frigidus ULC029]